MMLGNPPPFAIFLVLSSSLNVNNLLLLYSHAELSKIHQLPHKSLTGHAGWHWLLVPDTTHFVPSDASQSCRHQFMSHLIYPGAFQQQASLLHDLFLH